MSDLLYSVERGKSARTIASMLAVLFPDSETVLDATYGSGRFWDGSSPVHVTGLDLNPKRARDVCADFTRLPFLASAFDVVIFDPPYHTDTSKKTTSIMDGLFGSFDTMADLRAAVEQGSREAWRCSRVGVIVKVQNYTHASRSVRMTRWVEDVMPHDAYGEVHQRHTNKLKDPKWNDQLSVYSVNTTFLAYRHGDQRHIRRRRPAQLPLLGVAS